uniref:26S proteasome non-ATPase regulatory subunit 4-like n=1 Tax=Sinocyclocheilus rhinocerous TaxID=307959 RepID=A0A673M0U6_9TELE
SGLDLGLVCLDSGLDSRLECKDSRYIYIYSNANSHHMWARQIQFYTASCNRSTDGTVSQSALLLQISSMSYICKPISDAVTLGNGLEDFQDGLVKLAKRLKKEKVNVDVINFGEEEVNTEKLTAFVNTLNGKEGTGSHLVTVPPGPSLADALLSSPILAGEGGTVMGASDFEFGVDPSADPELALALRVSMEEQRQRQEEETRRAAAQSAAEAGIPTSTADESEEALLKMSASQPESGVAALPDFSSMTEEEQIAYAMQMSLAGGEFGESMDTGAPMDTAESKEEDDYDVMQDPEFLQSVLENLPGVDPNNEAIRNAMGSLASQSGNKQEGKKDDEKKK